MTRVNGAWRENPSTQDVCDALAKGGARALFVGGCVRNALLGVPVNDVDIATDALPERVIELARAAGLKALPTGLEHGTITVVSGGHGYEVTTFRRDVETHGRHATVAFSEDMAEDAARRDFTMNALYAEPDGRVLDPLGGLDDLWARRLRFIGNAEDRIREDYLRSLRYFRFHAWYGDPDHGFDPDAIAAISANLDGLEHVSRERIGGEILRLLAAPDPAPAVAGLRSTNVLAHILPGCDDRFLGALVHIEQESQVQPDPIRRLAALGGDDMRDALRLSRAQVRQLDQLREAVGNGQGPAELGYRLGEAAARDVILLRAAILGQTPSKTDLNAAKTGSKQCFPVQASDLIATYQGRELGDRLALLEARWISSGFTLGRDDLIGPD
jgi:poly(A) polymerase